MEEIWKDIIETNGLYQVSNLGRVKSVIRTIKYIDGRERIYPSVIINTKLSSGYYSVGLSMGKNSITRRVHRLIAIAFIPNPENKPQINHIDGNKLNNSIENLEWCTISENSIHAVRTGLLIMPNIQGVNNGRAKINESDIVKIRELCKTNTFISVSKIFNVSANQISWINSGKSWSHIK